MELWKSWINKTYISKFRGHIFKLNMKFQNKHLTISTGNNFVQEKKYTTEANELNKNNNEKSVMNCKKLLKKKP